MRSYNDLNAILQKVFAIQGGAVASVIEAIETHHPGVKVNALQKLLNHKEALQDILYTYEGSIWDIRNKECHPKIWEGQIFGGPF